MTQSREVRAPRGSQRTCKGWGQEAAMRMLMNNLDPEVAEHPDQLIHAGQVCVADGSELAAAKLERVLTNDPAMGVIRHTDAGYDLAATVAAERGVRVPMSP